MYSLTRMIPHSLVKFVTSMVVLVVVDLLWLSTGGPFAIKVAENIQGSRVTLNPYYAGVVYVFLAYMLLQTNSYLDAFLYGVSIYAVYDFTTLSIFQKYDLRFAMADTLWGGILFVLSRYLLSHISRVTKIF